MALYLIVNAQDLVPLDNELKSLGIEQQPEAQLGFNELRFVYHIDDQAEHMDLTAFKLKYLSMRILNV